MNILITICGRGGSKGVKNKNFKFFLGHPLIYYTIAAANHFKKGNQDKNIDICVNSDSEELLKIAAKKEGVDIIKRPDNLATDRAAKIPVIKYSVEKMETKYDKKYDYIIDLDITSPLRKEKDIQIAFEKLLTNKNKDLVFTVVPSRRNPYFNMIEKKDNKLKKIIASEFIRRQDAPEVYDMNASIYCYNRDSLVSKILESPLEGDFEITLMEDTGILDIDHENDFMLMEILAKYFYEQKEYKKIIEAL